MTANSLIVLCCKVSVADPATQACQLQKTNFLLISLGGSSMSMLTVTIPREVWNTDVIRRSYVRVFLYMPMRCWDILFSDIIHLTTNITHLNTRCDPIAGHESFVQTGSVQSEDCVLAHLAVMMHAYAAEIWDQNVQVVILNHRLNGELFLEQRALSPIWALCQQSSLHMSRCHHLCDYGLLFNSLQVVATMQYMMLVVLNSFHIRICSEYLFWETQLKFANAGMYGMSCPYCSMMLWVSWW